MTTVHTLHFGGPGESATRELAERFQRLKPAAAGAAPGLVARIEEALRMLASLDRQYGSSGAPPVEEADALACAAIVDLARLDAECARAGLEGSTAELARIAVGVALWAMRHELPMRIEAIEHVASALGLLSNDSRREELGAVIALMDAFIAHVRPMLSADLERSNPQRPWRILNANLAITAIRSGDAAAMEKAFDMLDAALPEERAGFYAEALALALNPRIPAAVREAIEARHNRWSAQEGR